MKLEFIDFTLIISFFLISLLVGIWVSKSSGKDSSSFFLSSRNMPWWLLGFSMVATTFAADTPNLVAGLVRTDGVSGNWVWWAFLLTGMLTVFFYARLWRRSGVTTELEFYELRYSGKSAAFLRGYSCLFAFRRIKRCINNRFHTVYYSNGRFDMGYMVYSRST